MTTSQALRSLEGKRLIIRRTPKADLRAKQVKLTARGRDVAYEAVSRLARTHEVFFRPLKDQDRLAVGFLQKMVDANDFAERP